LTLPKQIGYLKEVKADDYPERCAFEGENLLFNYDSQSICWLIYLVWIWCYRLLIDEQRCVEWCCIEWCCVAQIKGSTSILRLTEKKQKSQTCCVGEMLMGHLTWKSHLKCCT